MAMSAEPTEPAVAQSARPQQPEQRPTARKALVVNAFSACRRGRSLIQLRN
ncbi:hypothetical protein RGR602_PB00408 (plasmid) [Rhizobium gallicum bv. gallicum R602sp]|uniref:Uncharacterized protein n=1 Tax=Rhizobium gallicum bv. gallicum R602sp TaxID=1041138 RepID=A0A0B4X7H5_9HYPH|nr:hypothetical protein RGR602_PB00408 [Rhizobium gallicum bv. gallicum R602sp]